MWAALNIKYDDFIRTTEERHKKAVKKDFRNSSCKRRYLQRRI